MLDTVDILQVPLDMIPNETVQDKKDEVKDQQNYLMEFEKSSRDLKSGPASSACPKSKAECER
jgi:hypothetical protein